MSGNPRLMFRRVRLLSRQVELFADWRRTHLLGHPDQAIRTAGAPRRRLLSVPGRRPRHGRRTLTRTPARWPCAWDSLTRPASRDDRQQHRPASACLARDRPRPRAPRGPLGAARLDVQAAYTKPRNRPKTTTTAAWLTTIERSSSLTDGAGMRLCGRDTRVVSETCARIDVPATIRKPPTTSRPVPRETYWWSVRGQPHRRPGRRVMSVNSCPPLARSSTRSPSTEDPPRLGDTSHRRPTCTSAATARCRLVARRW